MVEEEIMPIYEFECDHCGFVWEKFYRAIPRIDLMQVHALCKNCKGYYTHKKLLSSSSFQLKGMGWGVDGYDNNPNRIVEYDEPS